MAGRSASANVTRYPGLQVQTSSAGLQIPVGWGTFRSRTNLLWYGDFKSHAVKAGASGGKGGGSVTTGFTYTASFVIGICEGPIDSISTVYVDSSIYTNGPSVADPSGSGTALSQAGLSINTGAIGQAVWSFLTSNHPTAAIGYSGIAIAYAANYALDSGASTPNFSFEIERLTSFGVSGTPDADPSLIIADFFQNTRTGVPSWPASGLLDPVSLAQFQAYTLAAGLLLSPVIDQQRSASDFLTEFFLATNSTCVWSEGLLKFIPYGDVALTGNGKTYTPNLTPVYALTDDNFIPKSDGEPPLLIDIEDQSDAYNVVQLEYLDRTNSYNMAIALASDAANVAQYGMRRQDPTTVHVICTPGVAAIAAQLYLQRTLYIRGQYKFTVGWMFSLLEPGDIVELTDVGLGLSAYPVRIIQIDEADGTDCTYDMIAEDLLVGVSNAPLYTMQNALGQGPGINVDPGGVEANLLLQSGDISNAAWTDTNASETGNVTTDQYGLTTAAYLVPTAPTPVITNLGGFGQSSTTTSMGLGVSGGTWPIGTLIVAFASSSVGTPTSVTDTPGNTYTAGTAYTAGGVTTTPYYSVLTVALPNTATITVHWSTATTKNAYLGAVAVSSPAGSPLDVQAAGTTATGTTPSISTGTLGQATEVAIGWTFIAGGASDTFTEAAGFTSEAQCVFAAHDALRIATKTVSSTSSVTYAPTLGTSRVYAANVISFKFTPAALPHAVSQAVSTFAGVNYIGAVCIQKNARKNARVTLSDAGLANGAYIEVDTNAGVILTPATALGTGIVVSGQLLPTLVSGIWQVVLAVQVPSVTALTLTVNVLSDAGALSWIGDGSNALNISQAQVRQGVAIGTYAGTGAAADGPLIFNPPSVLTPAGPAVWAAVAGGPNWGGCNVWTSTDGTNYQSIGTITGGARYGTATASFGSGADPDTSDTLAVDLSPSGGTLTSASDATADNGGTLSLLDAELVCFSTATLTNPSRYNLTTYIRRGFENSTIAAHLAGAPFIRLDAGIFDFPYLSSNVGQTVYAKFQPFNIYGRGTTSLSNCVAYPFVPNAVGATAPAAAAWTAIGTTLSNLGVSTPALQITGASDNPSASGIDFLYRQTGTSIWSSAGIGLNSTQLKYITAVQNGQTYDVGIAYVINGVDTPVQVIASAVTVGTVVAGPAPGTTLLNDSVAGTGKTITLPAGSYAHVDIVLTGIGGAGAQIRGFTVDWGGSGASTAVKLSFAVTPGTTVITYTLPSAVGSPATATATGLSLSAPSGVSSPGNAAGGAPAAATGGTNNYAGHAGALGLGGGAADISGVYHDQTTADSPGIAPGGGGLGSDISSAPMPGAGASIQIIART